MGNNGTVFVLNGSVDGAFSRDNDASLVNLEHLRLSAVAPEKVTQFDHGESDAKMENGRNGKGWLDGVVTGLFKDSNPCQCCWDDGSNSGVSRPLAPILALMSGKRTQFSGASSISAGRILGNFTGTPTQQGTVDIP